MKSTIIKWVKKMLVVLGLTVFTVLAQLFTSGTMYPFRDNFGSLQAERVAPELKPYVNEFEHLWGQPVKGRILMTEYLGKSGVVGICYPLSPAPNVYILKSYWLTINDIEREQLVFHEMGHCFLHRLHDTSTDEHGIPLSLMHPTIDIESGYYRDNRDYYITELFAR